MKRIAILSVYDSEGIVHRYLEYYIRELEIVVSHLIIVVIGYMNDESIKILKKYTSEIYIKDNRGFDAAAYKLILEEFLNWERLSQYDALILSNDTCFGPFVSFHSIFNQMDKMNVDFWGLKYCENNITNHLQSNFLVFNNIVFPSVCQYFKNQINANDNKQMVCIRFEQRLFKYLVRQGFKYGYYGTLKYLNNYKAPDYCLMEEDYPVMKKRCFEQTVYSHDNCVGALLYLQNNTDYEINMVLEYIKQKYGIEYDLEKEFKDYVKSPRYLYERSIYREKDIEKFCIKNRDVYIYGAGKVAAQIYGYYYEYLENLQGFIISDEQDNTGDYLNKKVFKLSDLDDKPAAIIVGCSKIITEIIRPKLKEYSNVLYLW